jgi:hypothetical protein
MKWRAFLFANPCIIFVLDKTVLTTNEYPRRKGQIKTLEIYQATLNIKVMISLMLKGIVSKLAITFWMCQKCGKMKDYN